MKRILPLIACSVLLIAAAVWSGISEWTASTFIPFNGHFQNFWSLERMSRGQIPFVDFPVYLGAGHLYAAWPFFWLLGGDFRAATAVHNALAGFCLAGSLVATMRLLGWRWWPTLLCSVALWQAFITMASAWSSVIGFRSALPVIIALCVQRFLPDQSSGLKRVLGYGLIMGAVPFWSNDYGIPATMAMGIVLMLSRPGKRVILLSALSCVAGLLVTATAVSWGHPMAWLQSSMLLPSAVQAWYFNPIAENKIYSLLDFPWYDGAFLLGTACLAALLATWPMLGYMREKPGLGLPFRQHGAITALVLCGLGGFCLSSLGGTYEQRYAIPFWRYMLPISLTLALLLLAMTPLGKLRQRYGLFTKYPIFSGGMSCVLLAMSVGYAQQPFALHLSMDTAERRGELFPIPSLNTRSWPEVAVADAIGRKFKASGISVGADYSSVVSVASASHQREPSYIIHAFGEAAQRRYQAMLDTGPQQRWETLDPDTLAWGLWIIRMAWPLHRNLFLDWEPVDRTAWTLLWKKRDVPLEMKPATCDVAVMGGSRPELHVYADIPAGQAWWADVAVNVTTTFERGFTPIAGGTKLVDLVEGEDAPAGADPTVIISGRWTAPLQDGVIQAPLILRGPQFSTLRLKSWPEKRSSVHVESCTARLVAPLANTLLRSYPTDALQVRTIEDMKPFETMWRENGANGELAIRVLTANPYQALMIRRGDRVILPDGRRATVVLRDFGNFAYVPDTPGPWPAPGSMVTIVPCSQDSPLGILVPPLEAAHNAHCDQQEQARH